MRRRQRFIKPINRPQPEVESAILIRTNCRDRSRDLYGPKKVFCDKLKNSAYLNVCIPEYYSFTGAVLSGPGHPSNLNLPTYSKSYLLPILSQHRIKDSSRSSLRVFAPLALILYCLAQIHSFQFLQPPTIKTGLSAKRDVFHKQFTSHQKIEFAGGT
jgi:hypothetical protein